MKHFMAALVVTLSACQSTPTDPAEDSFGAIAKLAAGGDVDAQHTLCYKLRYGDGVPANHTDAVFWCQKASDAGLLSATTLLAELHYFGLGVPADPTTAFPLYQSAAEKGHVHAQMMLGIMHLRGDGTPKDARAAADWLSKAANRGYDKAVPFLEQAKREIK